MADFSGLALGNPSDQWLNAKYFKLMIVLSNLRESLDGAGALKSYSFHIPYGFFPRMILGSTCSQPTLAISYSSQDHFVSDQTYFLFML